MPPALLERLYRLSPPIVQNLFVSGYGFVLHRRRYGGACRRYADELRRSERFSRQEMSAFVDGKVREIVALAAGRSAYHRDRFSQAKIDPDDVRGVADLERIPFLDKEDLRRSGERILTRWPEGEKLYVSSTSGTTGKAITLYTSATTERRNYAFFLRLQRWMGVRMGESRATFYGRTLVPETSSRPPFWRYDLSENSWQFSSYHLRPDTLDAYVEKLARIAPTEIRGYPSSVVQVARALLRRRDLLVRPRAVQTTAETLLPGWRSDIEAAFGCAVFDQYGSSEMSHYVSQCERGTYHIHPEYGFVEILAGGRPAKPGEEGEVVCTSFVNTTMPLIRYRIGDLAVPGADPCACGRPFPMLERITGRLDDVLVTADGRRVGRLDPVFKGAKGIVEAQIVQTSPRALTLNLVIGEGFGPEIEASIVKELKRRLGESISIDVRHLSEIPKGPNGKFRPVVRAFAGPGGVEVA